VSHLALVSMMLDFTDTGGVSHLCQMEGGLIPLGRTRKGEMWHSRATGQETVTGGVVVGFVVRDRTGEETVPNGATRRQ
jgi:hypothetical protein